MEVTEKHLEEGQKNIAKEYCTWFPQNAGKRKITYSSSNKTSIFYSLQRNFISEIRTINCT